MISDNLFEPRVEGIQQRVVIGDFVARYRFIVCCQPSRDSLQGWFKNIYEVLGFQEFRVDRLLIKVGD